MASLIGIDVVHGRLYHFLRSFADRHGLEGGQSFPSFFQGRVAGRACSTVPLEGMGLDGEQQVMEIIVHPIEDVVAW